MRVALLIFLVPLLSARTIRVATYNTALSVRATEDRSGEGVFAPSLRTGTNSDARRIAEVVQIIQPDVLLLNEFDYDANGTAATRMNDKFFKVGQNGRDPQDFPFRYVAISNTGIHTGFDLDNNGIINPTPGKNDYGEDSYGFGEFPGQFGMAVFSKFPIDIGAIRTFEEILWKDMPGNLMPPGFYSGEEQAIFRLSSKSHWDVPIQVHGTTFHLLASHPTPPTFDGAEDRNGRRNHDEIRLWADYLTPGEAGYLNGGLGSGKRFVIAGDQNADPSKGDSVNAAIKQLLDHPLVNGAFTPERTGDRTASNRFDTATFRLRADYVLPSREGFHLLDGAVYWPTGNQEGANLVTVSDHRPVYLDLELVPLIEEAVRDLSLKVRDGTARLSWKMIDEVSYRIEESPDLDPGRWTPVTGVEIGVEGDTATVTMPAPERGGYYRIAAFYE